MAEETSFLDGYRFSSNPSLRHFGDDTALLVFMTQTTQQAENYVNTLGLIAQDMAAPTIDPEFPTGPSAPATSIPTAPSVTDPVWSYPAVPSAFSEVLDVSDLGVESFDEDAPTVSYSGIPAAFDGVIPTQPTVNLNFDDPTLDLALPAAPDFLALSVRPFDGVTLPTLDADEPVLTAVEPSVQTYTPGTNYTSSLLTALQTQLESRIAGGTGLGADAEQALWDRNREREARTARDAELDLERRVETLGFLLPPGVYHESLLRLRQERDYQDRGHSREVMIESARLELDQVKHSLTTATSLETMLVEYSNNVEQRLFEAAKYATDAAIQIYNAKVEAFGRMVEVYRTKVQIYAEQINAQRMLVDVYEAEIRAEQAKADVNRSIVERYRTQVDAALASIRVYEAEIQGIQTKADIERTKVMVFGEQIKGYNAQVGAYTAGIEAYRASIEGAKAQVDVYSSKVGAYRAKVDAITRQVEARVSAYRGRIDANVARWDGYKAEALAESQRVQALTGVASARADIYRAEVTGTASYNDVLTKQWQATLDQNQRTADIAINAAKANAELYVTTRSLALDAAKVGATVYSQLGAAALNAFNFSSSVSQSWSEAASQSFSQSTSLADSTSDNTNTNYSYSV